jgi:hypothetical protein
LDLIKRQRRLGVVDPELYQFLGLARLVYSFASDRTQSEFAASADQITTTAFAEHRSSITFVV